MIDLRYVKKLVDMLDESSVDSIEISTEKGVRIRIAKSAQQRMVQATAPAQAAPVAPAAPLPPPAPEPTKPELERASWLEVKSPMVGTFYGAPEPGGKPYVAVGDRIRRGQVLCIIEAMKIMNELESEVEGLVKEISVQDAHPVEYGQVLFRIDPNG